MSLGFSAREVPILHSQCHWKIPLSFPCESQFPHSPAIIKSLRLGSVQKHLI